jgi:transposase
MNQKRKRPNYTKEFKQDAIKLVTEQGYSCPEVGRRLGIPGSNVSLWVRIHRQDQQDLSDGRVTRRELEAENRRLKKENKRLEMEREILKKAAAFFAKESSRDTTLSGSKRRPTPKP